MNKTTMEKTHRAWFAALAALLVLLSLSSVGIAGKPELDGKSAQAKEKTAPPGGKEKGAADADRDAALDCISQARACSRSSLVACIQEFEAKHPEADEDSVTLRKAGDQKLKTCALPDGVYRGQLRFTTPAATIAGCPIIFEIADIFVKSGRIQFRIQFKSGAIEWIGAVEQNNGVLEIGLSQGGHLPKITGKYDGAEVRSGECGPGVFRILK